MLPYSICIPKCFHPPPCDMARKVEKMECNVCDSKECLCVWFHVFHGVTWTSLMVFIQRLQSCHFNIVYGVNSTWPQRARSHWRCPGTPYQTRHTLAKQQPNGRTLAQRSLATKDAQHGRGDWLTDVRCGIMSPSCHSTPAYSLILHPKSYTLFLNAKSYTLFQNAKSLFPSQP